MNGDQNKTQILDRETVKRKIIRMALEIAEQNTEEQSMIVAGIAGNGQIVAESIAMQLKAASSLQIETVTIQLDKKNLDHVSVHPQTSFANKVVLLVDDVANTGRTLFYALKPFLAEQPKRLQTAVLVERSHKLFPIQSDYKGLSIATTLQEHIAVETEGEEISGAWLY